MIFMTFLGNGEMIYADGNSCKCNWNEDQIQGRCIFNWSDSSIYASEFKNNKPHGN